MTARDHVHQYGFSPGCLFLPAHGVLIAADLHIGMEEELRAQGLHFPLREEELLLTRFREAIAAFRPRHVVLNGDIIHSFATVPRRVHARVRTILGELAAHADVTVIAGSHDRLLPYVAGIPVHRSLAVGEWLVVHGDRQPDPGRPLILGHEHPVVALDMAREPCFLLGRGVLGGQDLVVLPAFNPLCRGVVVNSLRRGEFLSPALVAVDPEDLCPVVPCAGEVFSFPSLGVLRKLSPVPE
jgi:putative SbcD/Mre11-related phosphoesterase